MPGANSCRRIAGGDEVALTETREPLCIHPPHLVRGGAFFFQAGSSTAECGPFTLEKQFRAKIAKTAKENPTVI
jgi:hypothetical protein